MVFNKLCDIDLIFEEDIIFLNVFKKYGCNDGVKFVIVFF